MQIVHELRMDGEPIYRCAQGGCQGCMGRLLDAHRGLVVAVVRRQWKGKEAYEDLIQEGRIALWRAIQGYDPGRGVAFSSYAWVAIERQVWQAVARAERRQGWQWLSEPEDPALVAAERWEAAAIRAALAEAVCGLPAGQAEVIVGAYGLDGQPPRSLAALGRQRGLSRERMRQLRNDALLQLRLPAFSQRLGRLCDQNDRAAYERMRALNRAWLRRRRGR